MEIFNPDNRPYVALCDLLKFLGWCESGGAAKAVIAVERLKVGGQVKTRKRCKIVADQVAEFNGGKVMVKPQSLPRGKGADISAFSSKVELLPPPGGALGAVLQHDVHFI